MKTNSFKNTLYSLSLFTAYLFTSTAGATTAKELRKNDAALTAEASVFEQIKLGISDMLAELSFPEVKTQVHQGLIYSATEIKADEHVKAGTAQLPEYKFKVIIAD